MGAFVKKAKVTWNRYMCATLNVHDRQGREYESHADDGILHFDSSVTTGEDGEMSSSRFTCGI